MLSLSVTPSLMACINQLQVALASMLLGAGCYNDVSCFPRRILALETLQALRSSLGKFPWRRDRLPTPVFLGFPCGSVGKESACNAGDLGSIPGLGRYPGEGKGHPLQYSSLENSTDCTVLGVAKSQTRLNDFSLPHSPGFKSLP